MKKSLKKLYLMLVWHGVLIAATFWSIIFYCLNVDTVNSFVEQLLQKGF